MTQILGKDLDGALRCLLCQLCPKFALQGGEEQSGKAVLRGLFYIGRGEGAGAHTVPDDSGESVGGGDDGYLEHPLRLPPVEGQHTVSRNAGHRLFIFIVTGVYRILCGGG